MTYSAADFKKYVFAKAMHRIGRIQDIINDLNDDDDFDCEVADDLSYQLDELAGLLWETAFIDDDDQAAAHNKWKRAVCKAHFPSQKPIQELEAIREKANTYDDGRPVSTIYRFGDEPNDYVVYIWHPDPLHPSNRPGHIKKYCEGPSPWRHRYVIVTAPGIIDAIDEPETPHVCWGS